VSRIAPMPWRSERAGDAWHIVDYEGVTVAVTRNADVAATIIAGCHGFAKGYIDATCETGHLWNKDGECECCDITPEQAWAVATALAVKP